MLNPEIPMHRLLSLRPAHCPQLLAPILAVALCFTQTARAQEPGIIVSPSGVMLKDGKPYRSIGGNVPFDSWKWFEADETHYLQTFADMKASGIKTVRLSTKGWYAAWKISSLSITDKAAYFAKMDAIVDAAAQNDVGVILLLFWWVSAVSDYCGEPEIAATIPGSKTYVAMAQFATDMAEHYKDNPAVVGYDVINEMNLLPDQPNSGQSVTGRWTAEGIQVMYANLFAAIRAVDPKRFLSTGGTDARSNQFHFSNYCTWNLDTPAQRTRENEMANPDPVDVLGMHYYPDSKNGIGTNWAVYNALALKSRKPFYAGEFGNGDTSSNSTVTTANFNAALSDLMANRVPLMSDWYMGSPQYTEDTVSPTGTGAWMWNAIAQANAQYEYGPWTSLDVTTGAWNSAGSWDSAAVPTTADDVYVPTGAAARTLTISGTAYARNLALGNATTTDQAATIEISGSGQLVLGQNSTLTFDTTTDGTTPTTVTVDGAHGQFLDSSSRSAILSINQSAGETKPAIVANTVSAYRMNSGERANITAETGQLNLFDGLSVGTGSVQQTGGIVRIGLDANLVGATPAGLALGTGGGSPKYVLSNGTLAASGITGTTAAINWQGGTISTLDGASITVNATVDFQLSANGTHTLSVADANQSMTLNATTKISGSGNLTKSGPGKLVLQGTTSEYTYTGTTTVTDGILLVKSQNALPGWNTAGKVSAAARAVNASDGTVTAGTVAFNVGGTGEWTTANITTILSASGRITFGDGSALGIDTSNASGIVTLTSQITGAKGITKLGTGTLTLNPGSNNSFTGITTVLGGTLQLGTTNRTTIPAASGFDVQDGILDLGGKSITLSAAFQATTAHPNPALSWAPFLTQPSRVTFAGGIVQNGTIINNTSASGFDSIYDAQSGTVSANLSGSAMLWKTTPGTLTLTGNNSYSGGTRIAKGTLILGHANGLGTSGDIEFKNGTLKYGAGVTTDLSARFKNSYSAISIDTNGQTITFANPIDASNASGLKKTGSGTLILSSGNSSYTGGTWVEEGTLQTNADGVLSGSNDLTVKAGAVVDLNGTSQSIGNFYSLGGNGTVSIVNNMSGTQSTLTINGSNTSQFGGILADNTSGTGTLALIKAGNGRLTLSGANTFTGPTTASSGSLELASASGPAISGNLTVAYGTWLLMSADNQFGPNATLHLDGEIVLQNTEQSIAVLTGGGVVQNDHLYSPLGVVANGTATLTISNSIADTFSGLIRDNAAGNGKVALIKTGNGTFTLTIDNSFTGGTTVIAGTLALAGGNGARTAGAGTLTINSGGTVNASAGVNNFGYVGTSPGTAIPIVIKGGLLISNNDNHLNSLTMDSGTVGGGAGGSGLYMGISNSVEPTITSLANTNLALISSNITPVNTIGIDVANGSAATDLLITGVITNAYGATGGITKTGNGTLVLTATASYSGATTISAGTLQLGDGTSGHNGSINSSSSIVNNATLAFNISGNMTHSRAISGTGNLTKTGNGTVTMAANNTYEGTTTINGGMLYLAGASGWALNGSRAGNEVIINSGATLAAQYSHQFGFTGTLANITVNDGGTFDGSAGHLIGQLTLNGNASVFSTNGNGLFLTGGLVNYTGSGYQAATVAQNLYLGDVPNTAVNLTVNVTGTNPVGDLTISGEISGPAGSVLTKTGNGMLVLSGSNSYTGPTSINAGTLKLTGSLHVNSAVTVNATATLMGIGTVNGSLSIAGGGTIAPGASAGTLTAGTTTISGSYACEISGTSADLLNVTSALTINPGATLAFSTLSAPTLQSYLIASCSGNLTGTFDNVTGIPAGYEIVYDPGLNQIRLERTGFGSWIALHGLAGESAAFSADPDGDGLANALEFVLGGEPNPANPGSNSVSLLPTLSESGGNFVFSFQRKDISEPDVALTCQWSTNLIFLSPSSDIPVGATSTVTDGVTVSITEDVPDALTDTINITVPAAKAAGGKIFLRLKAETAP